MVLLGSSTSAPQPRRQYGPLVGYLAAFLLILFALVHLFRIDTFIPELTYALDLSQELAIYLALFVVVGEVFALPVLLRMSMSPLARLVSGFLAGAVPLVWLMISVVSLGNGISTAQLGEFYALPSSWPLLAFNIIWLILNVWTLWLLRYEMPKQLSKQR